MGIRLGIGKAHRTRDRGQGHVGLKELNDVESRSSIPSNFPKESFDFGQREGEQNNPIGKGGIRRMRRQSMKGRKPRMR